MFKPLLAVVLVCFAMGCSGSDDSPSSGKLDADEVSKMSMDEAALDALPEAKVGQFESPEAAVRHVLESIRKLDLDDAKRAIAIRKRIETSTMARGEQVRLMAERSDNVPVSPLVCTLSLLNTYESTLLNLSYSFVGEDLNMTRGLGNGEDNEAAFADLLIELDRTAVKDIQIDKISVRSTETDLSLWGLGDWPVTKIVIVDSTISLGDHKVNVAWSVVDLPDNWLIFEFESDSESHGKYASERSKYETAPPPSSLAFAIRSSLKRAVPGQFKDATAPVRFVIEQLKAGDFDQALKAIAIDGMFDDGYFKRYVFDLNSFSPLPPTMVPNAELQQVLHAVWWPVQGLHDLRWRSLMVDISESDDPTSVEAEAEFTRQLLQRIKDNRFKDVEIRSVKIELEFDRKVTTSGLANEVEKTVMVRSVLAFDENVFYVDWRVVKLADNWLTLGPSSGPMPGSGPTRLPDTTDK